MRGSLTKLINLSAYLKDMDIRSRPEVKFHYIIGQDDAANILKDLSGIRVLSARPETRISFQKEETARETLETVLFVLDKDLDAGKTVQKECEQYDTLLELADELLGQLRDACNSCDLLSELRVTDATVRPEVKLFGSWNGYSISISLS